ncbi:MAG: hypothetical protein LBG04_03535 [Holosporaceae bacterium]|jgi:hypothetical protein|nr:hypothetical protein [Holosporaceae bacterium]
MRKVILGTVMLFGVVGAMEIPEGQGDAQREAAVIVDAFSQEDADRFVREARRQMRAQEAERQTRVQINARLERLGGLTEGLVEMNVVTERSADLVQMDLHTRHMKVSELYAAKFRPFMEMFTRRGLDVMATMEDLDAVKRYVDNTKVVMEQTMTWRGDYDHGVEFMLGLIGGNGPVIPMYLGNYKTGKAVYESQQARLSIAGNAVFPVASFDVLVDSVNSFYQDMRLQLACIREWRALLSR